MLKNYRTIQTIFFAFAMTILAVSCKKDDDNVEPAPTAPGTPALRAPINYSSLTSTTLYDTTFIDEYGDTTVDRREGRFYLNMSRGLSAYAGTALNPSPGSQIDSSVYENMFANKNNGFTGNYAYLNGNILQLRNITSSSKPFDIANEVRNDFSVFFGKMARISAFRAATASQGNAGVLFANAPSTSKYLVDENGIEYAQVISKSMIGAIQLDYICNVLLDKGLAADNSTLVTGKNYTQLEHNWDVAYGFLTNNSIYAKNATDAVRDPMETLLGSYVWEYNKASYSKMHLAFLKGRAAIVNNDRAELKVQSDFIRTEIEKAIAASAMGYLKKWQDAGTDAAIAAHAIGEGAGFIYSLRFCKMHGADEAYSDNILNNLGLFTGNGFWDLTVAKKNAANDAIDSKF